MVRAARTVTRRPASGRLLAFAVWTSAALAPAAVHAEPAYEVGRITVHGGNLIQGAPDGVIYERRFGPGCQPLPGFGPKPFSGPLERSLEIEIEIAACPDAAPAPRVRCTWSLHPWGHQEEVSFTGLKHGFALPKPKLTGVRSLELTCRLPGTKPPTDLEFPFYVTFGEALLEFKKPSPEAWYRFATEWGAGFDSRSPENTVVRAVQLGMFGYGQENWRYGYCMPTGDGDSPCTFPEGPSVACGDPGLICEFAACDPRSRCKCSADAMLDESSECQFTDCFGFTAVLRTLSGTMGIGGFQDCEICGAFDRGFATRPELRSSDPRFAGNLLCGEEDLPCRYAFYNHELTYRDQELFDATFGSVYLDGRQAISLDVRRREGEDLIFEGKQVACFQEDGYGTWPFYDQRTRSDSTHHVCRRLDRRPASIVRSRSLELYLVESGGRPRVAVDVGVDVHEAGTYLLRGGLYAGEVPVALISAWRFQNAPAVVGVTGESGERREARLLFSSEAVFEFELGPQRSPCGIVACGNSRVDAEGQVDRLRVALSDEDGGLIEQAEIALAPLSRRFRRDLRGELPARFLRRSISGMGVDRGDDDRFAALRVEALVEVYEPGDYYVVGRLAVGDDTVAYAVHEQERAEGRWTLALRFPGAEIEERNLDGAYRVTLELYRREPRVELMHSAAETIGDFFARRFR